MMEHGARRCRRCGSYHCTKQATKTDAEKAIDFMESYVLARARAKSGSINIEVVVRNAKEAYLNIHTANLDEIRKEMSK